VVDVDTLRADGLSIYGNRRATSPNLDAFAKSGVRFEWAFSQAPYTLPSQVSILTSLYPWSHGVVRDHDRLGPAATTMAELFRDANWATGAFVDGGFLKPEYGVDQGFDTYRDLDGGGVARLEAPVLDWLRSRDERPFLLFVHTYDVHSPYDPGADLRVAFTAGLADPSPGFEPTSERLEAVRASHWTEDPEILSEADIAFARALYDAEVAEVDAWFGRLLEFLDRQGLSEQIVLAVVSDHGEEFQEHGSVLHEKLYSTVTRVPLLIRAPGGARGVTISATVETVDLLPTLLELAGISSPAGLHGRSLAASVTRGEEPEPRAALSYSPHYGEQRAIATATERLILTLDPVRTELFRYREDPFEARDLATAQPERVTALTRDLRRRVEEYPLRELAEDLTDRSPELEAQLRALGYLR
jgi:arylsulfatase A-like enzyme